MDNQVMIDCTREALQAITHPRLFEPERGYCGRFSIELTRALDNRGILSDPRRLLELEYQKSEPRHGMRQRPDIVFHIPVEVSGAVDRRINNFAVWAFKLRSQEIQAQEDFRKLDEMFEYLNYPIGFFINISDYRSFLHLYRGQYANRLYAARVSY